MQLNFGHNNYLSYINYTKENVAVILYPKADDFEALFNGIRRLSHMFLLSVRARYRQGKINVSLEAELLMQRWEMLDNRFDVCVSIIHLRQTSSNMVNIC